MENYDVVIVGAGPAGLRCAEKLAKSDKTVLLLEKNEVVGPKVCGGGLPNIDLERFNIPDELLEKRYKAMTIHSPFFQNEIRSDNEFLYTIDRKKFGQWQLGKIDKNKVKIRINTRVTEIQKDYVVLGTEEKIGFKYLIGADGANSIVRKYLGLKIEKFCVAIQYIIPSDEYDKLEFFFDPKLFNSWYAWIFPRKDFVSIGCGCNTNMLSAKKLRENFNLWLEKNKIDVSSGEYQAYTINYDYQGYKFENIFLAGESAGLVSGLTGEGIHSALTSGEEVAKSILDENYNSEKIAKIAKIGDRHTKILNFLDKLGIFRNVMLGFISIILKSSKLQKIINKKLFH
ncbi:MAG: NAD(P)/FAD-dependent oxidoreductase [Candidatus Pacebacteria bacterium]|nr:NAD(P)/FAD-dependent oxidoreductase [Candidatus Paceibacterota bacterium]